MEAAPARWTLVDDTRRRRPQIQYFLLQKHHLRGQLFLATINEATIVHFAIGQSNNLELAVSLAKRGNLPGAENLTTRILLFPSVIVVPSIPATIRSMESSISFIVIVSLLLLPARMATHIPNLQSVPVQPGHVPPLLQYLGSLLTNGKLNAFESLALSCKPGFTKKQADLFFPPDFADDFPVSMQISHKYSLIFMITKLGLLFVFDLETASAIYRNQISPDPIFLTAEVSSLGGFYAINRRGQVLLATVNEAAILPYVSGQLNNWELAITLANRRNLPGAENLVVQRFHELLAQMKYMEAAELAAESQGILCKPDTVAKFQSIPVQPDHTHPLLHYFGRLLSNGKLNAFDSLELSRFLVCHNKMNVLESWLAEDKLECTEELGDLVKTVDIGLAIKIFIKARATPKVVAAFADLFEELVAQMKYKEAAELAAESAQGCLLTPDTVAKLQSAPVQPGQTPPLLHYFETLLRKGKTNAFESLKLSRLVANQNKKNLLEFWPTRDKTSTN
ncbi:hypothetical protein ACLOJK_008841 [Asimina triloba]